MRHFVTSVGLESRDNTPMISLEEEQVMLDEAGTASAGAENDLQQVERIIEVSDGLEDLAVIADGIEEASPAEVALIENAGNLAVAGTDIQPDEIIPSMESYVGTKIATEGIRETARKLWENIKNFLKRIWVKVEAFFYKIFGTIPRLRSAIDALEKRVEEVTGKQLDQKTIKVTSGLTMLSTNYVAAKNESDVKKGLETMTTAAKFVYGSYVESVAKRGVIIADAIRDFDPAKAEESAGALRMALKAVKPDSIPGIDGGDKSRFPGFTTYKGASLPGNVSLACKWYVDSDDTSVLGALDRFRNAHCDLISTSEKDKAPPSEIDFTTMTTSGMKAILKDASALLDTLEDYKRGAKAKAINKSKSDIEAASEKAAKAAEAMNNKDEGERVSLPYYKTLINFNAAYMRWSKDPAIGMLSHSMSVIKTAMMLVQKSCSAYKD